MFLQCQGFVPQRQRIGSRISRRNISSNVATKTQRNNWKSEANRIAFLDKIATQLNIKRLDDWYSVSRKQVIELGGRTLLKQYGDSLTKALTTLYPDHPWDLFKFKALPHGYWKIKDNQREYLDRIGKQLGVKRLDDWKSISAQQIEQLGGSGLLSLYNDSLRKALEAVFSDHPWNFVKQNRLSSDHWKDTTTQRKFFDDLALKLNVRDTTDWNSVTWKQVANNGGIPILSKYNHSLTKVLSALYPEQNWDPIQRIRTPRHYWADKANQRRFLDQVAKQLHITDQTEWYNVTVQQINQLGGRALLSRYGGSLVNALSAIYPERNWKMYTFLRPHQKANRGLLASKAQLSLHKMVKNLFSDREVLLNYKLADPSLERTISIDIFIPSLSLALEYQGEMHYFDITPFGPLDKRTLSDRRKVDSCKMLGITLIHVPFWWDKQQSSLAATINSYRPDVEIAGSGQPIPLTNSQRRAPDLCVPPIWTKSQDPTGWWLIEKHDGVRVYWNGRSLYSHEGTKIYVPPSITNSFPSVPFEGELWCDYKTWSSYKLVVTDALFSGNQPYEQRLLQLKQAISSSRGLTVVKPTVCANQQHLDAMLQSVWETNGEGIVLRKPSSLYHDPSGVYMIKVPQVTARVQLCDGNRLQCTLPNDVIFAITSPLPVNPNHIIQIQCEYVAANGSPVGVKGIKLLESVNWADVSRRFYPYYVGSGRSSKASCRGCYQRIPKDQLRIKTKAHVNSHALEVSFCINKKCLDNGIARYKNTQHFQPFDGNVWVEREHLTKMPSIPYIHWRHVT